MLERTAASLESCSFQRVLSKSGGIPKRCKNLHSGFWQHGASAIELSTSWPSWRSGKKRDVDPPNEANSPPQTGLMSSAFMLDFLYPRGTYPVLRRLYPALPRTQDCSMSVDAVRPRNFASGSAAVDGGLPVGASSHGGEEGDRRDDQDRQSAPASDARAIGHDGVSRSIIESALHNLDESDSAAYKHHPQGWEEDFGALKALLARPNSALYLDVSDGYSKLNLEQKQHVVSAVVAYLSTSESMIDINRALAMLHQIPTQLWDDKLQVSAFSLHLRAGDLTAALELYRMGLPSWHLERGFQLLLETAAIKKDWLIVLKTWLERFSTIQKKSFILPKHNDTNSSPLTTTNADVAVLYFAFEQYLEVKAAEAVKCMNLYLDSRRGLEALRRWLAQRALRQPCSPKMAKSVLLIWNNPELYQEYLGLLLERWKEGLEPRSGLFLLPKIYTDYLKIDGAQTPVDILRGMFDFYYPSDPKGLAEVYRDWHQSWGDLDQWGYEKYLKFYSACGDTSAVQALWARYSSKFPEVVTQPLGFRSTLNAFARTGDVAGAEKEFTTMIETYKVTPDIDSWNTLLKTYTKVGDYTRALQCFNDLKQKHKPDAFTYAQVMALAARRGDLATVIDFFDQSQNDRIAISREMALSLVTAYCHNDRLEDALKICVEFSKRSATSPVVWNQLLYFNGQKGDLHKCYDLLKSMMDLGVDWDHQTAEFLLGAMVHVGQVELAFELLESARRNGAFPVGAEHFSVVMAGAVRLGRIRLVTNIMSSMRSAGMEVPLKSHVSVALMAFRQQPLAARTKRLSGELRDHVLAMLASAKNEADAADSKAADASQWKTPSALLEVKKRTADVGRALKLLIQQRRYTDVETVMSAYVEAFPEHSENSSLPPEIVSALMTGYLQDNNASGVYELWVQTFEGAMIRGTHASGVGISPAYQYDLARPLDVVMQAFDEDRDGAGLLRTIKQVLDSGFKLTGVNWNRAIRLLPGLGHWGRAMELCEHHLMDNWSGWSQNDESGRLMRRHGLVKDNRALAPYASTILNLHTEWLEFRKHAALSDSIASQLQAIERRHPKLHRAFITTDYEHLAATWVFPRYESLEKAIHGLLAPLSYDELQAMRNALDIQLKMLLKGDSITHSPFHVIMEKNGVQDVGEERDKEKRQSQGPKAAIRTRPISQRETMVLDVLLWKRQRGKDKGE
ncbi:hypothetical protein E4U59_002015 [Claviceps monticola]|nr:hypothetical protein E4U59_002015 [Claviceps monticola]